MKTSKTRIFSIMILVLFLILIPGCKNNIQYLSQQNPKDALPATEHQSNISSIAEQEQEANLQSGEITDPVELEKLWQEYF